MIHSNANLQGLIRWTKPYLFSVVRYAYIRYEIVTG